MTPISPSPKIRPLDFPQRAMLKSPALPNPFICHSPAIQLPADAMTVGAMNGC
jgi:hypothetical protein